MYINAVLFFEKLAYCIFILACCYIISLLAHTSKNSKRLATYQKSRQQEGVARILGF